MKIETTSTGRKISRAVVPLFIGMTALCTTAMNAKFGYSMGSDEMERWVYVAFGISLDVVKVFGLAYVMGAFAKGFRLKASLGLITWAAIVFYSFVAAIGFSAMTRTNITAERNFDNTQVTDARQTYESSVANISRLETERDLMKNNQRYISTAGCSVPTARMTVESKLFCEDFWKKGADVKDAKDALSGLKSKIPTHLVKDADPQATWFAKNLGVTPERMTSIWAVTFAIIAELVASVGTYAFSPTRAKPVRKSKAAKVVKTARLDVNGDPVKRGRPKGSVNKPKLSIVH